MKRKIRLTEAQFDKLLHFKINEQEVENNALKFSEEDLDHIKWIMTAAFHGFAHFNKIIPATFKSKIDSDRVIYTIDASHFMIGMTGLKEMEASLRRINSIFSFIGGQDSIQIAILKME